MNTKPQNSWRDKPMKIEQEKEWISVSELANRMGRTKQTAYNHVKAGVYEVQEYKRGKMNGFLVCVVKGTAESTKDDVKYV